MVRLPKISFQQISLFSSLLDAERNKLLNEIKVLKKALTDKEELYKELTFQKNALVDKRLQDNNDKSYYIIEAKKINTDFIPLSSDYNPKLSAWKKVCFILSRENKVLSAREIIDVIYNFEPELRNVTKEWKKTVEDNIFAILSKASKSGALIRFKEQSEYKYGFKNWFDENSEIKKQYLV